MPMKTRLLLADDHAVFRESLRALLGRDPDIEVVAEASNGADAFRLAKELKPDVIIMDIRMPGIDGINATRRLLAERHTAFVEQVDYLGKVREGPTAGRFCRPPPRRCALPRRRRARCGRS
jgi:chemotaxis response regulator CheB